MDHVPPVDALTNEELATHLRTQSSASTAPAEATRAGPAVVAAAE